MDLGLQEILRRLNLGRNNDNQNQQAQPRIIPNIQQIPVQQPINTPNQGQRVLNKAQPRNIPNLLQIPVQQPINIPNQGPRAFNNTIRNHNRNNPRPIENANRTETQKAKNNNNGQRNKDIQRHGDQGHGSGNHPRGGQSRPNPNLRNQGNNPPTDNRKSRGENSGSRGHNRVFQARDRSTDSRASTRSDHAGNRSSQIRGGNRNRGNGRNGDYGRRGPRKNSDSKDNSRAQTPQQDWFSFHPTNDLQNRTASVDNLVLPPRENYGGTYNQNKSPKNIHEDRHLDKKIEEKRRSQNEHNQQNRNQNRHQLRDIGFKKLEEIYEKNEEEIICILEKQQTGFDTMLQNEMTPDKIILIMRLIKKLCESAYKENVGKILGLLCCPEFLNQLKNYIQDINLQEYQDKKKNKWFWNDPGQFWESLCVFYETLINIRPNTACDVLPRLIKATVSTIRDFEDGVCDETKDIIENLQMKLVMCQEEREKKKIEEEKTKVAIRSGVYEYPDPPDNFRLISLYPTIQEITDPDAQPFIRPIIEKGKYKSVDDYLDVQFRLLREDFVGPLRKGICTYLANLNVKKGMKKERVQDVFIYSAIFTKSETINSKVVRLVQLDLKKKKIRLENNRRFIFGSLVCFTKDNFQNVIFGTIYERKIELLRRGIIGVELNTNQNVNFEYNTNYIMVECSVYFEPYYQVLKALQMMTIQNFPLVNYIVNVEREIDTPGYLAQYEDEGIMVYFQDKKRNLNLPILANKNVWPSAERLGLDNSQYDAFYSALTQEFCVIQGPPGTGKTYIGLRIAEILLSNTDYWKSGPMLVVCFTNHALDQFLEGILKFTNEIVRIGGQSKNETLQAYNIRNIRTTKKDHNFSGALHKKRKNLEVILKTIKDLQKRVDMINSNEYIFNISDLARHQDTNQLKWFHRIDSEEMLNWLLGGYQEMNRDDKKVERKSPINQNEDNSDSDEGEEFFDAYNDENERILDDNDDLNLETNYDESDFKKTAGFILNSIESFENEIAEIQKKIVSIDMQIENNPTDMILFDPRPKLYQEMDKKQLEKDYIKYRLDQYANGRRPIFNLHNIQDLQTLTPQERWDLYWVLLSEYRKGMLNYISEEESNYREIFQQYEELRSMEDIRVMKTKAVIGMTTTGAARYQTILQALRSPIVIVEEAAEVLESHVVVSLTSGCQQLILIGDHKQLRPSTSVYELAKQYKLEISLFERMVKNDIHCSTLGVQHRMRSEIAKLIVPLIYPKLENHETVLNYPSVRGVTKSLFFITHNEFEQAEEDNTSKKNVHEAKFLISLARHLLLQGYEPSEITILTTYAEQMFYLWKKKKLIPSLKDVKITVVDNFQGEENKIILLSLVRSNDEGNIGFLKIDNRVCVALSRAKEGLFIIGNMDCLTKRDNPIWPSIKETLLAQGALDTHLTLRCQNHPDMLTRVKEPKDFRPISEGGCTLQCGKTLHCGHRCKSLCHVVDKDHAEYRCKEPCKNILCEIGHICPDLCFKECGPCMVLMEVILNCGHRHKIPCHQDPSEFKCTTLVNIKLDCEHYADKPCYRDLETFKCPHPCEIRKLCGHQCERKCHVKDDPDHLTSKCYKPCTRNRANCSTQTHECNLRCFEPCLPCEVKVKKTRTCGHQHEVACNFDVNELECKKRCGKIMQCGHKCKLNCNETCGNCQEIVVKTIDECGHKIRIKCCETPLKKNCKGLCPLILPCGHRCQAKCNEVCTEKCKTFVDCKVTGACGHKFKVPCYKKDIIDPYSYDILKYCKEPCSVSLKCNHPCAGTCGKCAQGRIHRSCQQPCGVKLVCGHDCENPCRETCKPCNKKCTYSCVHSKCGQKCGEPCKPCQEPCPRKCEHSRCSKPCGTFCDVDPCSEPCPKLLKCKHPCLGFCSEPCPPICRTCDPDHEAFEIMFGNEDDEDARFIYLEECSHSIESDAMDQWMQSETKDEINVKKCPRCSTLITKTQRYLNYIKKAYLDIIEVKQKLFGTDQEIATLKTKITSRIDEIKIASASLKELYYSRILTDRMIMEMQYNNKGKRQVVNIFDLRTYDNQLEIIQKIINIYKKYNGTNDISKQKCLNHANFLLEIIYKQKNRITEQEIQDFQLELDRFEKIVQICNIEAEPAFKMLRAKIDRYYIEIWQILRSIEKFGEKDNLMAGKLIKDLRLIVNKNMIVTPEEKKMICKALGMSAGHWYKCPNGHTYCITECGGAMEVGKCNECGAKIGGTSHSLLSTNRHDGEMDGSRFAAWSEEANNMRNFRFDD